MYSGFEKWLNEVLDENMPLDGKAVCFNLYEEDENEWSVQLISASYFDEEDDDWCCEEVFTTGEDLYIWKQKAGWEDVLKASCDAVVQYLEEGKHADALKEYDAVAAGFVDGDLEILYMQGEE